MPLLSLLIQLLLPVAVEEVKKKIADKNPELYETHKEVATGIAAPIAAKAAFKGMLKSKTAWIGLVIAVLGFFEQNQQILSQLIGADKLGLVIGVCGGISMILRTITTDSIVEKADISKE